MGWIGSSKYVGEQVVCRRAGNSDTGFTHLLAYLPTHARTDEHMVCLPGEQDASDARRRAREHGQ